MQDNLQNLQSVCLIQHIMNADFCALQTYTFFSKALSPKYSKQQQIICVKPYINKPKQLISKQLLNKIYPEQWVYPSSIANQKPLTPCHYRVKAEETEKQYKVISKPKIKQTKYLDNVKKLRILTEEWFQIYGKNIIYQRFQNNFNNIWSLKNNYSVIDHNKKQKKSQITFRSTFESANLLLVYSHNQQPYLYSLILQNDTNTFGYSNWFYFAVKSEKKYQTITIQIINMRKDYSLFQSGMKIAINAQDQYDKRKWFRGGDKIGYYPSQFSDINGNKLHTLTFQYTIQKTQSWVYFAYSYPYTYSDLKADIRNYKLLYSNLNIKKIGFTVLKNQIYCLQNQRIQKKLGQQKKETKKNKSKPIIVIMARVHPSQTVSSFVMRGVIQQLFSSNPHAQHLRKYYSLKLFPMINPDGVIHGNSRTSFTGNDLNRRWISPSLTLHPQIHIIKQQINQLVKNGHQIFAMIDLHGHSGNHNAFFYGCPSQNNSKYSKNLSKLMSQVNKNFSYKSCRYFIGQDKISTARVTFKRDFSANSYTLQTSLLGCSQSTKHYSLLDLQNLGKDLVNCIAQISYLQKESYYGLKGQKSFLSEEINKVLKSFQLQFEDQNSQIEQLQQNISDCESSSSPSIFNYDQQYLKCIINLSQRQLSPSNSNKRYSVPPRNLSLSPKKRRVIKLLNNQRAVSPKLTTRKIQLSSFNSQQQKSQRKSIKHFAQFNTIQKNEKLPHFSAFNFKSRKTAISKRKIGPNQISLL